jgi:hypothetical protein
MEPAARAAIIPGGISGGGHVTSLAIPRRQADVIQGAGDHDVEYFGGWVISAALTLATVLVVWHFHI